MKYIFTLILSLMAACASVPEGGDERSGQEPTEQSSTSSRAPEPSFPTGDRSNAPEPPFGEVAGEVERCGGENYLCVRVVYGTNRDRLSADRDRTGQAAYGTEPETIEAAYAVPAGLQQLPTSTRLETGEVIVTVPTDRGRGDPIRAQSARKDVDDEARAKFFTFLEPVRVFSSHADFANTVDELYAATRENDAILHVHGFNVAFRSGAFRAAQLKVDTGFEGPVFYFSWPSNARLTEYFNDQVDGDVSARALANFMLQIRAQMPEDGQLHIIAHSMGTRVFSQAAALLRDSEDAWPPEGEPPLFGAVILAAGDLDSGLAQEWLGPPDKLAHSVTFLTSSNDRAVRFSGILRNFFLRNERRRKTRIGFFKPSRGPVIFPGVNVFDISFVNANFWQRFTSINHSTYAQDTFSLDYIAKLLDDPTIDPEALAVTAGGVRQCRAGRDANPVAYWVLGAIGRRKMCGRRFEAVDVASANTQ